MALVCLQAIVVAISLTFGIVLTIGVSAAGADEVVAVMKGHVEGQVSFGPVSPVARPGVQNYRPKSAQLDILDAEGKIVARPTSNDDGRFELDLEPGIYTIRAEPGQGHVRAANRQVTVRLGETTQVGINYDSGVR